MGMARSLYGEGAVNFDFSADSHSKDKVSAGEAMEALESSILGRREFTGNYFSYILYSIMVDYCCCLQKCFARSGRIDNRMKKHMKMQVAKERLLFEHDIQHIIQMNRINSLVHRALLRKHQRRAVNFSRSYIITDKDIEEFD